MKLLCPFLCLIIAYINGYSQKIIPLYTDSVPNSIVNAKPEKPSLTIFLPAEGTGNGTAIIVCPGGGYSGLAINREGMDIAAALNKAGITAFVLRYRLPSDSTMRNKEIGPLQDAQQAIKIIRGNAKEYKIDPSRIGIMGFSAGGHLASTLGTHFNTAYIDNREQVSLRPDFMVLVYPVISFTDSLAHIGTRTKLIGTSPTAEKKKFFSNELQITDATPPTFLVHAGDDNVVKVGNSIVFYEELIRHKIPADLHIYQKGGHGFGMASHGLPVDDWTGPLYQWLNQKDLLKLSDEEISKTNEQRKRDDENRIKQEDRVHKDWAYLDKYGEENRALGNKAAKTKRIVFMGNSITEGWKYYDSAFFIEHGYIDRGISGQTTPQMLVRFRSDVINLHPDVVVILAGINDIAQNTGPITLENTFGNIVSMAELARASKIRVVLSSVLPAYEFPWRPGMQPAEKVIQLNAMIKAYAVKNRMGYIDYFSAMVDERNGLKKEWTTDGVHPNLEGYKIMEPLANKAISGALSK